MIGNEPLPYIIQLSIELPFVLFHVSVTVCIAWNIWKGRAALSTGFFLIYLMQSVCDLVSYSLSVVFMRMPKIQAIPDPILAHPIGTLALFLINGLLYLQCIFHITIAMNRYTMIVHPRSNWNQVWSGGYIKALIASLILISMLPALPRLWCNTKAVNHDLVCDSNNQALVMATNMITNVENQKSKLHLILLSKIQGYTNIAHILKDLKDEFDIDGLRLANACGHRSFATFLTSTTMQKYCRAKDDELKTTYYGIPDSRTAHIVKEMQLSVDAQAQSLEAATQLRRLMTEARSNDAVQLRQCLREVGAGLVSKLVSIRNDLNEVSQNMHVPQKEGMRSRARYGAKDAVSQCNSIVQETQAQGTDHAELMEKAVQTKGPVPHEILVKLIFVNSCDRQLNLMNVKVEYDENVQKKEFVRKIASNHPSVGKCEVKSLRYYDPTFDCDIEMAEGECIMPKRNYVLVLVDKQLTGEQSFVIVMLLICSSFVAIILYMSYRMSR